MTARCLRCGAGNEWIEGKATHTAATIPEGMVLVPREPTEEMIEAAFRGYSWTQDFGDDAQGRAYKEARRIYCSMLEATHKEQL